MPYNEKLNECIADAKRFLERAERMASFADEEAAWVKREPKIAGWQRDRWYAEAPESKRRRRAAVERARLDLNRSLSRLGNQRS